MNSAFSLQNYHLQHLTYITCRFGIRNYSDPCVCCRLKNMNQKTDKHHILRIDITIRKLFRFVFHRPPIFSKNRTISLLPMYSLILDYLPINCSWIMLLQLWILNGDKQMSHRQRSLWLILGINNIMVVSDDQTYWTRHLWGFHPILDEFDDSVWSQLTSMIVYRGVILTKWKENSIKINWLSH